MKLTQFGASIKSLFQRQILLSQHLRQLTLLVTRDKQYILDRGHSMGSYKQYTLDRVYSMESYKQCTLDRVHSMGSFHFIYSLLLKSTFSKSYCKPQITNWKLNTLTASFWDTCLNLEYSVVSDIIYWVLIEAIKSS